MRPSDVLELSFLLGPVLVWVKRQEGRPVAGSCSRKRVQLWNKINISIKLMLKLVSRTSCCKVSTVGPRILNTERSKIQFLNG